MPPQIAISYRLALCVSITNGTVQSKVLLVTASTLVEGIEGKALDSISIPIPVSTNRVRMIYTRESNKTSPLFEIYNFVEEKVLHVEPKESILKFPLI